MMPSVKFLTSLSAGICLATSPTIAADPSAAPATKVSAAEAAGGTTWTGILYEDGVEIGRTANLTVPPTVNVAGTNCNFLGRSQAPAHYALRGTLSNFRIYDRALSGDEAIA